MTRGGGLKAAALACVLLDLAACSPASPDIVVGECIRDGEPLRYCECVAEGMKHSLGPEDYAVFTRFIMLGDVDSASPEDILKLMEEFELSPAELADLRGRIAELTDQLHDQCSQHREE